MAEKGARPKVPRLQRRLLNLIGALTTPLLPDDYLEMINPLWSTRELRGRIESIDEETPDAATVLIKPGYRWEGHDPGQYLRIGLDIKGRRHWRAYSLTSDPERPDGCISITVKNVDEGTVSPYLVRRGRPGSIVSLGGVEGEFVLPDELPDKLLFISAGSGITPIMSMLRSLEHRDALDDVVLLHSARKSEDVIFGDELRELSESTTASSSTSSTPARRAAWARRTSSSCARTGRSASRSSPAPARCSTRWRSTGRPTATAIACTWSASSPSRRRRGGRGRDDQFLKSDCEAECDGSKPILVAGEEAGLDLPFGCREGICHTCVGTLRTGKLRDLRTGKVTGAEGETVRTCIHAPEGPIEIEL